MYMLNVSEFSDRLLVGNSVLTLEHEPPGDPLLPLPGFLKPIIFHKNRGFKNPGGSGSPGGPCSTWVAAKFLVTPTTYYG